MGKSRTEGVVNAPNEANVGGGTPGLGVADCGLRIRGDVGIRNAAICCAEQSQSGPPGVGLGFWIGESKQWGRLECQTNPICERQNTAAEALKGQG